MHPPDHREGLKTKEQQRNNNHRESMNSQNAVYDGQSAESGYSQAIFDLLREPVTLGMQGVSSNRGHRR